MIPPSREVVDFEAGREERATMRALVFAGVLTAVCFAAFVVLVVVA